MSFNLEYEILELALDEFDLITAFVVADERLGITRKEMLCNIKSLEKDGFLEVYTPKNDKHHQDTRVDITDLSQQDIEGSSINLYLCQSEKTRQRLAELFSTKNVRAHLRED